MAASKDAVSPTCKFYFILTRSGCLLYLPSATDTFQVTGYMGKEFFGMDYHEGSGLWISYNEINSDSNNRETGKIFYL